MAATDPWRVLVPREAEAYFRERPLGATPLYYCWRQVAGWARVLRKLGLRDARQTLHHKLLGSLSSPLGEVRALWASPQVMLSEPEANAMLDVLPGLRVAYWQRIGMDGVPLAPFTARAIPVSNAGSLTSRWVAEFTAACIAADAKSITLMARSGRPPTGHYSRALTGLHVAIVGTGAIGTGIARLTRMFGCRVTGLVRDARSRRPPEDAFDELRGWPSRLLETAAEADYLVLAVPLLRETSRMVGAAVLGRMQPGSVLVNFARPGLVDGPALLDALRKQRIKAAYVSRMDGLNAFDRLRASRTRNLFLSHDREAHVAEKNRFAFAQFAELLEAARMGRSIPNRVA